MRPQRAAGIWTGAVQLPASLHEGVGGEVVKAAGSQALMTHHTHTPEARDSFIHRAVLMSHDLLCGTHDSSCGAQDSSCGAYDSSCGTNESCQCGCLVMMAAPSHPGSMGSV